MPQVIAETTAAVPLQTRLTSGPAIVFYIALAKLALHLYAARFYGYFGDELYFIACARHLAWGYVDQPPLIAAVVDISLRLFGDTLGALRILPAVAAGGLVALSGFFAHRLGGGTYAVAVTMIGVALAPFDLAVGS